MFLLTKISDIYYTIDKRQIKYLQHIWVIEKSITKIFTTEVSNVLEFYCGYDTG